VGGDWRPDYSPQLVHRELDIIRTDLRANAVRICGRDPGRVLAAAEYALGQGLEVWLSPERWNATPKRTLDYLVEVAAAAESLRQRWPDRLIFTWATSSRCSCAASFPDAATRSVRACTSCGRS